MELTTAGGAKLPLLFCLHLTPGKYQAELFDPVQSCATRFRRTGSAEPAPSLHFTR